MDPSSSLKPYQFPSPQDLSYARFIVGVGLSGPWQFYFIFNDQTESNKRRTGNNFTEFLIPEGSVVAKIKIQTTLTGELRGIELRDADSHKLL